MLIVSLRRGTNKIHEVLAENIPQNHPAPRRLLMLAMIHEANEGIGIHDAKVMLYQEVDDENRHWVRKESGVDSDGKTTYSETECEDAISALSGFEASVRGMLDRLTDKRRADRIDHSVATMEEVTLDEVGGRRVAASVARS